MAKGARETKPHWADQLAERIEVSGRPPVLSTGISPSGQIHIGNMREVLTADAVYRALADRGVTAEFNYVADNFDPLRKVYPFLDAETFRPRVGQPLSEIPAPDGGEGSYADHFLRPFLRSLEELGVRVDLVRADELYRSGQMNPWIRAALEQRDRIAAILHELTGKQMKDDWSPYTPWCTGCRRLTDARVTGFSAADETVRFECACGTSDEVPFALGGKLTWRVDWPARWMALGVTVEPFGKDHATRGGSYDTGARIVKEVFGGEPPFPIPYEWIQLAGRGDMASSRGNVLSIADMLEVVPPEVLRYTVLREPLQRTIKFDPGLPLLQLVDEVDDPEAARRDPRAVELSMAAGFEPVGVPYKHLVVVAQVAEFDAGAAMEILRRTGFADASEAGVRGRMGYVKKWLATFAPEEIRFEVCDALPEQARNLDSEQRAFLRDLAERLRDGMDGGAVHEAIYEAVRARDGVKPAELFRAIYLALLGKERGPRAGAFIAVLGPEGCAERFREASASAS